MLNVNCLREKTSKITGIPVEKLSNLSWDEFDKIIKLSRWELQRNRGGLVADGCSPLSPEDIKDIRKKAEKVINSFKR